MLGKDEEHNAAAVDSYFLHSLPGTILQTEGLLAVLTSNPENSDELPTLELLD